MHSVFKKNKPHVIGLILLGWLAAGPAGAQSQPSASAPNGETASATGSSSADTSPAAGTTPENPGSSQALDYLYNRRPAEGSPAGAIQRANERAETKVVADEALGSSGPLDDETAARFERFLGSAEVPSTQVEAYLTAIDGVHGLLKSKGPVHAWSQLLALSEYQDLDAGVSNELANRIQSIWNLDKAAGRLERSNEQLRDEIDLRSHNADSMSQRIRQEELRYQRKKAKSGIEPNASPRGGGSNTSPQTPGSPYPSSVPNVSGSDVVDNIAGKLQLTEEYLRTLEAKARIKMNEMRMTTLEETAKENFASYIGTLFQSKRYLHVIMGADFYRRIFNDSEYPVEMANQVNASLEIVKDVQSTVEVFGYKLGKGEIANATDRLQEAFALGETHPLVLGVPRGQKELVGTFARQLVRMRNLIEAREFGELESLLNAMKEQASDFDATKARAIVNAVKLESKLRLGKAKLAAQKGNLDLAMKEFQAAAQAWPANPELEKSASQFFDANDMQNQSLTDFDRDFENGNYRIIYEKQLAYAPAMKGDEERQEKLKQALEKVQRAEMALEKANLLMRSGDHYGAWEAVELAAKDWPEDRNLNRMRAELSGKSAEFVAAVNRAKDAETRGELGYSLTWYLNAQRRYPASRISNEAIERLGRQILDPTGAKKEQTNRQPEPSDDHADRDAA